MLCTAKAWSPVFLQPNNTTKQFEVWVKHKNQEHLWNSRTRVAYPSMI
uniref:Uncharacterized protein n=1 Tax=Anguilla anguilla TaxID=7936 RepID=A0A0E9XHA9_ANGAN